MTPARQAVADSSHGKEPGPVPAAAGIGATRSTSCGTRRGSRPARANRPPPAGAREQAPDVWSRGLCGRYRFGLYGSCLPDR